MDDTVPAESLGEGRGAPSALTLSFKLCLMYAVLVPPLYCLLSSFANILLDFLASPFNASRSFGGELKALR